MPPKKERLTKKDFSAISQKKIIRDELFDVGYLVSEKTKVACIVSKKTAQRAVDRNKIKRRIYNAFKEIKLNKTYFILFYPKKKALYTPFSEIKNKMGEIFAKL